MAAVAVLGRVVGRGVGRMVRRVVGRVVGRVVDNVVGRVVGRVADNVVVVVGVQCCSAVGMGIGAVARALRLVLQGNGLANVAVQSSASSSHVEPLQVGGSARQRWCP